ncbi:MAG: cardiolipin synthase [Cyclobacteriaceae bacterium]|nr:cardiolipin synthase [Cyclobacteriaceae bacterium]
MELTFGEVLTIGYYLVAIGMVVYVILDNRAPLKTISWILVLLLLPVIGLIFYFFFGHNFRKEKLFEGKKKLDVKRITRITDEQSLNLNVHDTLVSSDVRKKLNIVKLLLGNGKSRLTKYNRVAILNSGSETYDELIEALSKAKTHIHLEYYIFEEGEIASLIGEILIKKAQEGVRVRLIYDQLGSWGLSSQYLENLRKAGVRIVAFHPVHFPIFTSKINYRNHRKIAVIDGHTGFLGGINISDKYIKTDPDLEVPWRDTHVKIEGDAVSDLQLIFLTDWYFLTDEQIEHEDVYFPDTMIKEECVIQIQASGPDTEYRGIMKAYFAAIATAKTSIHITSPYFIPNESLLMALKTAAASGVEVSMILPGISDTVMVQYSSRSYFEELLESGISIHLYKKGFIHAKVLIVDGILSTIGTANMDFRSLEQNMEVNAIIYDRLINKKLMLQFQKDIEGCEKITLEQWRDRPVGEKAWESVSRIFAPLF